MKGKDPHAIILFDGVCCFCHSAVNFIIRRDPRGLFRFASLQSETGRSLLKQYPELLSRDSLILIEEGAAYCESLAALRISMRLQGAWKLTTALLFIPKPVRDAGYRFIAKRRYRWFGKRDTCILPTEEERERFISAPGSR